MHTHVPSGVLASKFKSRDLMPCPLMSDSASIMMNSSAL
ncbi:hypothetical protein C4J88_4555 [Pseudomonas sp. R4-39-08]|nr:hypothetical protein C4J88_4555 [Pseudomonas sp. R4-39-08]